MTKLISLRIENFRGIKNLECDFSGSNICCIIGHCDSGKSTILLAISYLFSTSWTIPITDEDFYELNIQSPIKISGVIENPPLKLLTDDKFGLCLFYKDEGKKEDKCLEIVLTVEEDLNPRWEIHNHNNDEFYAISNRDRSLFNIRMIDDYFDTQFSMSKYSLLKSLVADVKGEEDVDKNIGIEIIRNLKSQLKDLDGLKDKVSDKLNEQVALLGGEKRDYSLAVPTDELLLKGNQISLHCGNVPVRLIGKGSRRQLSLGLQLALEKSESSIILIDEIEQSLEPYKVKTIVRTLKDSGHQVFLTTHSENVLFELDATDLLLMKKGAERLIPLNKSCQRLLRSNPNAFFFDRVIVCEGQTEFGFVLELDRYLWKKQKETISSRSVSPIIGNGDNIVSVVDILNELNISSLCFMDGDKKNILEQLDGKTKICRCEDNMAIEQQIFKDAPESVVKYLINDAQKRTKLAADFEFLEQKRTELGNKSKSEGWYKSVGGGRFLGEITFDKLDDFNKDSHLYGQIDDLISWIKG